MNIWKQVKIEEIGEVIGGGTPSTSNDLYYGEDIPWITPRDLSGYQSIYISNGARNITKLGLTNSSARVLPKGTVLFSSRAPIGYVAIAENDVTTNQGFKSIICNESIAYNKFIYYSLIFNREKIEGIASGSTFKEISGNVLKNFELLLPPIDEQKQIAEILYSLDEKIELNRKLNANLESIASALFKRWFVDFEFPDQEGKPYKSNGGKMIDSELGEIPDKWSIDKIGKLKLFVSDYVANGSFASLKENVSKIYEEKEYALFVRNTDLKNKFASKRYVDKRAYEFLLKTHLKGGEVIISNVADVGSVYKCPKFKMPMVLGNNVILLDGKLLNNYLYLFFISQNGQAVIDSITSGSAQLKFNKTDFRNLDIIKPKDDILEKFDSMCENIFQAIQNNQDEVDNLGIIRDSLLPRLMSGKIRVT